MLSEACVTFLHSASGLVRKAGGGGESTVRRAPRDLAESQRSIPSVTAVYLAKQSIPAKAGVRTTSPTEREMANLINQMSDAMSECHLDAWKDRIPGVGTRWTSWSRAQLLRGKFLTGSDRHRVTLWYNTKSVMLSPWIRGVVNCQLGRLNITNSVANEFDSPLSLIISSRPYA
ncbi:hypothetical protein JB92DRAFT_2831256 [Gautieria morchelliformis]|nr:hypothetical protein JB92DRAFT_2831256 [Gautieria morchelliformis]